MLQNNCIFLVVSDETFQTLILNRYQPNRTRHICSSLSALCTICGLMVPGFKSVLSIRQIDFQFCMFTNCICSLKHALRAEMLSGKHSERRSFTACTRPITNYHKRERGSKNSASTICNARYRSLRAAVRRCVC
jgi:hypothetical protein